VFSAVCFGVLGLEALDLEALDLEALDLEALGLEALGLKHWASEAALGRWASVAPDPSAW
jgi:hypothetical protein